MLLALAILLISPVPAAGDRWFCSDAGGAYKQNSTYESNLRSLADALIGDATRLHSATGAAGEGPDRVYGALLCRGDSASTDCAKNLRDALSTIISSTNAGGAADCARHRDVAVYSELYQLRFSGQDFLSSFSNEPEWADVTNPDSVPQAVVARVAKLVTELLGTLADAAARSPDRYAVGEAPWPSSSGKKDRSVYGLAQCTWDMPLESCRVCLDGIVAEMPQKLGGGKMGGLVFRARCTLRYEMDLQFFNVTNNSNMQSLEKKKDHALLIIATVYSAAVICTRLIFWLLSIIKKSKRRKIKSLEELENMDEVLNLWRIQDTGLEFSFYNFTQIVDATDNFSHKNILGEGGFGPVYKGVFPDGQEVGIKRLSARSRQGLVEFKNEIQVIAKLQHRNLVRLLGCCIHEEEKMLIYEFLTNKSLDYFIFGMFLSSFQNYIPSQGTTDTWDCVTLTADPIRRASLNWKARIKIIKGIAQGLLYLHNHSRLRIIHRDLKASNILLDSELNPKISDFGMARIFPSDATQATASRLVGTYGYIAPEYASDGLVSIKSDVFSFGVLLLEIICGKKSAGFQQDGEFYSLLEYAWQLWKDRRWNVFIDQSFGEYEPGQLMTCLTVALMCVQEKAIDRPTMPNVVAMLSSDGITLPEPSQPAYTYMRLDMSVTVTAFCSRNDVTITTTNGR